MMKFTQSSPLQTLERVFPGFMNFALGSSQATSPSKTMELQSHFEKQRALNGVIHDFCLAADLPIDAFLTQINEAFAAWMETEITPEHFEKLRTASSTSRPNIMLIDVREDWEREIASIEGSVKLSQENAEDILRAASSATHVIIYCHHGIRSLYAASYFQDNGVPQAKSLKGGIDAYTLQIDGSLARY